MTITARSSPDSSTPEARFIFEPLTNVGPEPFSLLVNQICLSRLLPPIFDVYALTGSQ